MEVQIVKEEAPKSIEPNIGKDVGALEAAVKRLISNAALAGLSGITREPPVDIYDDGGRLTILIDLPGVKKESIRLRVGLNFLEVQADPTPYVATGKPTALERISNFKVYRRIEFPFSLRLDDVKAVYKDGILQVTLSKMPGYNTTEVAIE